MPRLGLMAEVLTRTRGVETREKLVVTVLAIARDRFLTALQAHPVNILREIPCGQDIGWVCGGAWQKRFGA